MIIRNCIHKLKRIACVCSNAQRDYRIRDAFWEDSTHQNDRGSNITLLHTTAETHTRMAGVNVKPWYIMFITRPNICLKLLTNFLASRFPTLSSSMRFNKMAESWTSHARPRHGWRQKSRDNGNQYFYFNLKKSIYFTLTILTFNLNQRKILH